MSYFSSAFALFCVAWMDGAYAASASAEDKARILPSSIEKRCVEAACSRPLVIRGWMVARFELVAMYDDPSKARLDPYKECIGIVLPPTIRIRLEQFNRHYVDVTGKLEGFSPSNVCGSAHLIVEDIRIPENSTAAATSFSTLDSEIVSANPSLPNGAQLQSAMRQWVKAINSQDISDVRGVVGPKLWRELEAQAADRQSRFAFLLDNKDLLLGVAGQKRKPRIDVFQFQNESDRAIACVCKRRSCNPSDATLDTRYQSFADPYFCLHSVLEDGRWYITDTLFTEIP
jgi:hypothetical protein